MLNDLKFRTRLTGRLKVHVIEKTERELKAMHFPTDDTPMGAAISFGAIDHRGHLIEHPEDNASNPYLDYVDTTRRIVPLLKEGRVVPILYVTDALLTKVDDATFEKVVRHETIHLHDYMLPEGLTMIAAALSGRSYFSERFLTIKFAFHTYTELRAYGFDDLKKRQFGPEIEELERNRDNEGPENKVPYARFVQSFMEFYAPYVLNSLPQEEEALSRIYMFAGHALQHMIFVYGLTPTENSLYSASVAELKNTNVLLRLKEGICKFYLEAH